MNQVKIICDKCKANLECISVGESSANHTKKEIWECPECNIEVMISYISTRNDGVSK